MPEDYDLDNDLELDEDETPDEKPSHLRKQLSEQAKARKAAEEEAAKLRKEIALRDSGLDLSNPQHKFFAEHSQAQTTEELKAEATALGFLEPPAPDVADEVVEQHAAGAALAAGADAGGQGPSVDDLAKAASSADELDRILREGGVQFVEH